MGKETILITGATGYVGGRLLKEFEKGPYKVRCLVRKPAFLESRVSKSTEVVQGDLLEPSSLPKALEGIDTAYYLVHSMGSKEEFADLDRRAASAFTSVARQKGVKKIIYLGGLGHDKELSSHLASRQEVGDILRKSGIPVIEFQASIIVGSGSLSFEMIRALVNRLPVMVTPRWTRTLAQLISIDDVITYLVKVLDLTCSKDQIFEIGGPDQLSYVDLMKKFAELRGLKRIIIPVPLLTPRLSSLWLGMVSPLYARIGKKLIDSVKNSTVVKDSSALEAFHFRPIGIREAIARALKNEDQEFAETRWCDASSSGGAQPSWGGVRFGSRIVDSRSLSVPYSAEAAFRPIQRIGGKRGWYYGKFLWFLRGLIDLLVGGVGLRRGRRDPEKLVPGDTVDFWRVEMIEKNCLLRLSAEMKIPGRAWLQFEVEEEGTHSTIRQTVLFDPVGTFGIIYWYSLYVVHSFIFRGMLLGIARAIEQDICQEDS